jgi:hypothetical protein
MAGIYERDMTLKREQVGDVIFIAQSDKVPFSRLLKRGPKLNGVLMSWPVQQYPERAFAGTLDGTDISSFTHTNRDPLEAYAMWLMTKGWMVSRMANLTKTWGVSGKEEAKQAADDGLILGQMIEKQLLSDVDMQAESGSKPYRSRGAFKWLSSTAQTVKPVPADYRPSSDCLYTGTLANFLPANLQSMLNTMAIAKKEPVNLTGYVGILLKAQMSTWPQRDTESSDDAQATMRYNIDVKDKKLQHVVDFFEFDAGKVTVFPSWYLLHTEGTGESTASSTRSGLFLDMDMWDLCWWDEPSAVKMPPQSGGPRGYHDALYMLRCKNPTGQGYAKIST